MIDEKVTRPHMAETYVVPPALVHRSRWPAYDYVATIKKLGRNMRRLDDVKNITLIRTYLAEAARACADAIAEAEMAMPPADSDPAMKPYSVLLLYPDYANDGGSETYYAWVQASDPIAAVAEAQRQALAVNEWTDRDQVDFLPLLVTEGHHHGQPMFDH